MSECGKWYWKMLLLRLEGSENGNLDVRRSWVFILCSVGVCLCFSIFSVHPKNNAASLALPPALAFRGPIPLSLTINLIRTSLHTLASRRFGRWREVRIMKWVQSGWKHLMLFIQLSVEQSSRLCASGLHVSETLYLDYCTDINTWKRGCQVMLPLNRGTLGNRQGLLESTKLLLLQNELQKSHKFWTFFLRTVERAAESTCDALILRR